MFEAKLAKAQLLKQILEAIKDLVTDANLDCNATGISMQSMDSSHVALVHLLLKADGFIHFRCDRPAALGVNLTAMNAILKCAGSHDTCELRSSETSDQLQFNFSSPDDDRDSEFRLKLLDLDTERMGILKMEYSAIIKMPSSEFQRIMRELTILAADVVMISCSKDGIRFAVNGEVGSGSILCKVTTKPDVPPEKIVAIDLNKPVSLRFALRYLNYFARATCLSPTVMISMAEGCPLAIDYDMGATGWCRFHLAPKIDELGDQEA